MKQIVFILSVVQMFLMPLQATGQERKNYLSIKAGTISFTNGLKDANFATGFDGEIVYGRYLIPNLAVEVGTGYLHDGVYIKQGFNFSQDIQAIPIILTVKVIYPIQPIELFAGAGYSVYFTKYKGFLIDPNATTHLLENDNPPVRKATVFGGQFVAGVNYCFSPAFFFGIEGKYIITEAANFRVFSPSLDGYAITGSFGFRF